MGNNLRRGTREGLSGNKTFVLAREGYPRVCPAEHRRKWQVIMHTKKVAVNKEAGGLVDGHSFKRFPSVMTTLENQSLKNSKIDSE